MAPIAVLTDIHANWHALEACLTHAAEAGISRFVILGDMVGYGADPDRVIARLRALEQGGQARIISGNHDAAVARDGEDWGGDIGRVIRWTRERVSPDDRAWLAALPLTLTEGDRLFVHADASAPAEWRYVLGESDARRSLAATEARLTLVGHVHIPALWTVAPEGRALGFQPEMDRALPLAAPRRWLAVLGAVGQPRDGDPAACYGVLQQDPPSLTFVRVAYDIAAAASRIRAEGLPTRFAERLFQGR